VSLATPDGRELSHKAEYFIEGLGSVESILQLLKVYEAGVPSGKVVWAAGQI
jgi:hypothetical protein